MGGPRDGLHGGVVVAELDDRRRGVEVPDVELVVVAAAGDLPVVRGPLETAHLHPKNRQAVSELKVLPCGGVFR